MLITVGVKVKVKVPKYYTVRQRRVTMYKLGKISEQCIVVIVRRSLY